MILGKLYLFPTPIGDTAPETVLPAHNLELLRTIDYFIVEDLRTARRFLSKVSLGKPIDTLTFAELNEHTPRESVAALLAPLRAGQSAGLMSEAGLPAVADPGAVLVADAHRLGLEVVPLVGPSSLLLALMASGLNGQSFAFNGYLPIKPPERAKAIRHFERRAITENQSQLFIETPYRNLKLFEDFMAQCAPETLLTVAADLLQPNQLIRTASITSWKGHAPDIQKRPTIFILGRSI